MVSIAHSYAHSFSDLWSTCSKNAPVIQEPVSHIWSAKERRMKCKDNLACGKMKGITAVTQRGRRMVRISNLGSLVSLAQMKKKQMKSWQNQYWFQQEFEWFVFRIHEIQSKPHYNDKVVFYTWGKQWDFSLPSICAFELDSQVL